MKEKIYYFGFRFEKKLNNRIENFCSKNEISLKQLVSIALQYTMKNHNMKRIIFDQSSYFKGRIDKRDKIETHFTQSETQRECARSFAFAYRLSMAEVFRISLEAYLDYIDTNKGRFGEIKHIYRSEKSIKTLTVIILYPAFSEKFPIDYHYSNN